LFYLKGSSLTRNLFSHVHRQNHLFEPIKSRNLLS